MVKLLDARARAELLDHLVKLLDAGERAELIVRMTDDPSEVRDTLTFVRTYKNERGGMWEKFSWQHEGLMGSRFGEGFSSLSCVVHPHLSGAYPVTEWSWRVWRIEHNGNLAEGKAATCLEAQRAARRAFLELEAQEKTAEGGAS